MNRRRFLLGGTTVAVATSLALPSSSFAEKESGPIDPALVGRFVGKSHSDLDAVRTMLEHEPALINAAWDWGNGDWETGLGAAAHVGRPEIAQLILERGARIDVFAATMLGHRKIVRTFLDEIPSIHRVRGPHGIPLLSHAIVGREAADELVELLLERGAEVDARSHTGMTPLMVAASIGRVEHVERLLARGADPALADAEARRAFDWAEARGHAALAERLRTL